MDMTPQTWPEWYDGRHINEVLFCQQFLDKHPMKCVRGRLFTVDGLIEDERQIGNLILEEISGVLTSGLSKIVTNLLASIKLQAYSPPLVEDFVAFSRFDDDGAIGQIRANFGTLRGRYLADDL